MTAPLPREPSPPATIPQRLGRLARHQPAALAVTLIFGLAAGWSVIGQAWLLSHAIDAVFLQHAALDELRTPLLLFLALTCLRAVAMFASEIAAQRFAARLQHSLRTELSTRLFALGPAFTASEQSGDLVSTILQSVEALEIFYSQVLPQLAFAALIPLGIAVILLPLDWPSALLLVVTAPLIPLFLWLIGGAAQALTRRQWRALRWMSAYFYDLLQGLTTLKSLNLSAARSRDIAAVSERYRVATLQVLRVGFLSAFVLELVATLSTAIIAVEIGLRLLYGQLAFAPALFILMLAPEFYLPLRTLGVRFHAGTAAIEAARRIFELLDAPLHPRATTSRPLLRHAGPPGLRLEGVTYTHAPRRQAALAGVTMELSSGSLTVLLGASGSGKSTLANLLLGFLRADSGQILLDGNALDQADLEVWRARVSWVPQHPYLLHATIEENLRLARPEASLADLELAIQRAGIDEFVTRLPDGLATSIGERGERLSAGQAQRIAIARALLKDAPCLLLDEPTSALDVETEAVVQQALATFAIGRTSLVITHRLGWLARADQVCVLSRGQLVQVGAPHELREQPGALRDILQTAEAAA